ncbi:MAG TPA: hypothetical protein VMT73_12375 [Anaerolineales bacterium]|nr:hypothetical protein [Anaerolineales bacterium]
MRLRLALFVLLFAWILSACGTKATETPTLVPTETLTPAPTLTPTPNTPLAILVVPSDMDQESSDLYQKTVYELTQQSGFRFQVRNTLTPGDVTDPTLKVVVALPPDPGIAALASAAPQTQFLAVNIPNITAGGNISVLSNSGQTILPSFLAGYIAAMITDDYHIGMIIPKDNIDAQKAYVAFANGMAYYCGLCQPFYYSTYTFPQYIAIPSTEDKSRYGGYANYLIDNKVNTLFVYPDLAIPDFITYIGTTGDLQIGTSTPNPLPAGWVVTIQPDVIKAIQAAWPNLVAGQGGVNVQSPIGLADIDPTYLTPGRQRLVEQTLEGLINGTISPGVQ